MISPADSLARVLRLGLINAAPAIRTQIIVATDIKFEAGALESVPASAINGRALDAIATLVSRSRSRTGNNSEIATTCVASISAIANRSPGFGNRAQIGARAAAIERAMS